MDTLENTENVKCTHGDDTFVIGVGDTVTITEGTNGGMGTLR